MKTGWCVLVVVALALSGCTGDAPDAAPDDLVEGGEVVIDPETGREQVVRRVPVSFGAGGPVLLDEDVTGTFEVQQHGDPGGQVQGSAGLDPGNQHRYDISDRVPVGVPVRIVLEIEAELGHGDLDLWLDVPGEEIWTSEADAPTGGDMWIAFHLVRSGDADIAVVVIYDDLEPAQTVDYTLRLMVESDPGRLLAGIPVTVPVPRGTLGIEATFEEDAPGRVWFWGPDDKAIASAPPVDGRWNLTIGADGDHVLMLPEGAASANVSLLVPVGSEPQRPLTFGSLAQHIRQTEPVRFEANTEGTTTFEVEGVPIQMGIEVRIERVTKDFHGRLEGPGGVLIDATFTDDVPFHSLTADGLFSFTLLTDVGVDGLDAGSHTATFRGEPNGAGTISAWIVYYARV